MAKVIGPLYSQAASGKHGSIVYARNPSGPYTRVAPGAALSPSGEQTAWMDAMTAVYTTWETDAGITAGRRAQWLDFARTWPVRDRWGRTFYLDAARWFMKFGIHRQRKGLGLHLGPPIDSSCDYYPTLTFTQEAWGIVVDADPRPTGDQMICLSKVAAQSTNRNFCPSKRRYVDHLMAANEWPYLIWLNGDLDPAEKRYFFAYRIIDGSGRPSSQQIDYVDAERWTDAWTRLADCDTYMQDDTPAQNYGNTFALAVLNGWGGIVAHTLARWDLSGVPEAAVVSTARTNFWCYLLPAVGEVTVHEGLTEWAEMQASWNDRLTGIAWGVAGGQAGVDYGGAEDTVNVNVIDTMYEWNVATMCAHWVADDAVNFGLWLRGVTAGMYVGVRPHEYGVPAEQPYISIIFGS